MNTLEASDTERAVNFMGRAFQNSNVVLANFSRLTQNVNENARQAGFSIEEITAASLHLGKEAGGASRVFQTAFSDMEMVLKELLDLTPEGASILDGLDIDPKDVGAIGLPEFLRRVATLTNDELQEVFGTEYWSKIRELTGSSDIEAIGELHRNLTTDMEGTIQAMAEVKNSGAPGAWEDLKSAINALNVSLGKAGILFLLEHAFNALRKFIDAITNAPGPVRTVIAAIIGMGPALLVIGGALKVATFALSGLVPLVKLWRNALILTRIQLVWLAISTRLATLVNSQFVLSLKATRIGMLLTAATARVTWASILGPVAALAAVGFVVYKFRRQILGALKAVWSFVKDNWQEVAGLLLLPILGPFALIATNAFGFRDKVVGVLKAVWNFIKGNWQEVAGLLLLPILGPFALIATNAFGLRDKLIDAFTKVRDFFMGIWGTIVGIFRDHWAKILAVIFPAVGLPILIARNWGRIVDAVDDIWSSVNDVLRGWIDAMVAFIGELPGRVLAIVKDIPALVADAIRDVPGLGAAIDAFTGLSDKVGGFFGKAKESFAQGGIVPGPLGRPLLATVHGGEMVLPVGASNVLAQMLEGFRLGPAALPQAPHYYGQMYRSSVTNRTVNINMNEPIVIQTQATDAKGIAQELGEAIQDQIRNVAYDHDGPVER